MDSSLIKKPILNYLDQVESLLNDEVSSDIKISFDVIKHLINKPGKRLRPSIVILSTTTPAFAVITPKKEEAPASLPSSVSIVISEVLSVPLNMMSVSLAAASIVILPDDVVMFTAELPEDILLAATLELV